MTIFMVIFAVIILLVVDIFSEDDPKFQVYGTIAYILGFSSSMLSGYFGMKVATNCNFRTTFKALISLEDAFDVALDGGYVSSLFTVNLCVCMLTTIILIYTAIYDPDKNGYTSLYTKIAAFGLGASSAAMFGRIGGGIYTKAADVGADLVGKIE